MALTREQIRVIFTVSFGNILEWFDIYSYVYLAPILARLFFNSISEVANTMSFFLLFGVGFLSRILGAAIFGHFGDRIGRKKTFMWSITITTSSALLMGFLPTHQNWGFLATILLVLLRLIQSAAASGEVPGTVCFLYEYASITNRKFMTQLDCCGESDRCYFRGC